MATVVLIFHPSFYNMYRYDEKEVQIRDGKMFGYGSEIKHPGSATVHTRLHFRYLHGNSNLRLDLAG
jgi:hypothetical protein